MTRDELIAELQKIPENLDIIVTDDGMACRISMIQYMFAETCSVSEWPTVAYSQDYTWNKKVIVLQKVEGIT